MPQPNFVPCRPAFSRIAQRSGVVGSASSVTLLPLRTNEVDIEPLRGESPNLAPGLGGILTDRLALSLTQSCKNIDQCCKSCSPDQPCNSITTLPANGGQLQPCLPRARRTAASARFPGPESNLKS